MRLPYLATLIAALGLCGCGGSLKSQTAPEKWTFGFWFWHGSPVEIAQVNVTLDVLFVHAGDIHKGEYKTEPVWSVYSELPRDLPRAREYWLVFRYTRQGVPDDQVAETLGRKIARLSEEAGRRNLKLAGVQLDVDSPTSTRNFFAKQERKCRPAYSSPSPRCSIGSATARRSPK
jgi:hypothetical protein